MNDTTFTPIQIIQAIHNWPHEPLTLSEIQSVIKYLAEGQTLTYGEPDIISLILEIISE